MGLKDIIKKKNSEEENIEKNTQISNLDQENLIVNKEKCISLDDLVENFIYWYYVNNVKPYYDLNGYFNEPRAMKNFIEKMAVWYEIRYPSYLVNKIMPGSAQENKNVSEEMFKKNLYLKNENIDISNLGLDWSNFYNKKAFFESLPYEEFKYIRKPEYNNILLYFDSSKMPTRFSINQLGDIIEVMHIEYLEKEYEIDIDKSIFEGKNIRDVITILEEKGVSLPKDNELKKAVTRYENSVYQLNEMLNCVMYRIIERGGNRIGPRRAFLFAKEFGTNINIPLKYGVDCTDPGMLGFAKEYLKMGGDPKLECYIGYSNRKRNNDRLEIITIEELIKSKEKLYEQDELEEKVKILKKD